MMQRRKRARPAGGLIRVSIHSRAVLAACHMPGIKHGGLFVPTREIYSLFDPVCLVVSLMNMPEIPVMGRVVWLTPEGAVGHREQGIGVQFDDDDHARLLREHIRQTLPDQPTLVCTHTF